MTFTDFHTHDQQAPLPAVIQVPTDSLLRPAEWQPRPGATYSVGIHPWDVTPDAPLQRLFEGFEKLAARPETVAIGECGLDRLRGDYASQNAVFIRQAEYAEALSKPVIIHCVKAIDEILRLHKAIRPRMRWTIHGFRGNATTARQLLAAGLDLSFGPKFNPEAVSTCFPGRLHVETDNSGVPLREVVAALAPFLPPGGLT
ncbi:MAG TPA: TatD family hydrolase [Candidatus Caccomonas pullistercoris]|nr:TatD family hydrolase [Candidatus Caccomonas pullistercoris]